jgi:poly(3-hydroxybutyrate) depolymerase
MSLLHTYKYMAHGKRTISRNSSVMRSVMLLNFIAAALLAITGVQSAQNQLQQVTANIGPNPNNVGMYIYRPSKLANPLPLIVAIHYCTGTAQAYFSGTQYANLADTYGYMVVYPNAPRSGGCFDVNTPQTRIMAEETLKELHLWSLTLLPPTASVPLTSM